MGSIIFMRGQKIVVVVSSGIAAAPVTQRFHFLSGFLRGKLLLQPLANGLYFGGTVFLVFLPFGFRLKVREGYQQIRPILHIRPEIVGKRQLGVRRLFGYQIGIAVLIDVYGNTAQQTVPAWGQLYRRVVGQKHGDKPALSGAVVDIGIDRQSVSIRRNTFSYGGNPFLKLLSNGFLHGRFFIPRNSPCGVRPIRVGIFEGGGAVRPSVQTGDHFCGTVKNS